MSTRVLLALALGFGACAAPRSGAGAAGDVPVKARKTEFVRGSLATRWRGRFDGGAHDQDAYARIALDAGEAERDAWSGSLVADAALDLDGASASSSTFTSLADASDGAVRVRLFEAFVDHRPGGVLATARLGRQIDDRLPVTATWDGLALTTRELGRRRWRFGLYGGIPARFDSAAHAGDVIAGAFVNVEPRIGTRARADWMHVEDRAYFGDARDDLFALDLRQAVGERIGLQARVSALDGRERDAETRATYTDDEHGFQLLASFQRLFRTQNQLALEFDPFTRQLLEQHPYEQFGVSLSKELGGRVRVESGLEVRHVARVDDEGPFNRDFERAFVTTVLADLARSRLDLVITGDRWNSGTDETSALSVDLSRPIGERAKLSVGTSYALYHYDLYELEEREHVRSWYLAWRYRRKQGASFDVRYQHEDALSDQDTLRVGATWTF